MYTINEKLNGVEIYFTAKPEQNIIETLRANAFRWHNTKKCWYNKATNENIEIAKSITNGEALPEVLPAAKSDTVKYFNNVSDYITIEEFEDHLKNYYEERTSGRYSAEEVNTYIKHAMDNYYNNESKYYNLTQYIRQAIIWKSTGGDASKFQCNGDNCKYQAVWDKLPTIKGLKPGKMYSAMWGYDQTQITTATHYGKAFGLDILITGGFGSGEVLLKRISKTGTFQESCMYFSENTYTDEYIRDTNTYTANNGR